MHNRGCVAEKRRSRLQMPPFSTAPTRQLHTDALRLASTPSRAAASRRPLCVHAKKNGVKLGGSKKARQEEDRAPARPARIVLVRHGESEGNVDEAVYRRERLPPSGTPRASQPRVATPRVASQYAVQRHTSRR